MGMIDVNTKLATAQAVTLVGDTASTNTYDSGDANSADMGLQQNLWVAAVVATAATSAGAATVQAVLQDSADNVTFADASVGPVVALAGLVVGAQLMLAPPPVGLKRYVRVAWRVGTAALTAGAFTAYISLAAQANVSRPSGFSVA